MIFSSKKYFEKDFIGRVGADLLRYGYKLNYQKTYFMTCRREVTGIMINGRELSAGIGFKRQLKKDIWNLLVKGEGKKDVVCGKLAYLKDVEPDYARKLKEKYKQYDKIKLFDFIVH
jgi:hypothetical protein